MTRKNALIFELREQVRRCDEKREFDRSVTQRASYFDGNLPEARVPVLAIVLMLENRLDALSVTEYAHVKEGNAEQARIDRLRGLLGDVSDEETALAVGLWEEVAE